MSIDIDKGFKRYESPIIEKIIAMRARFREVVVGKNVGDAYAIIASEFYCSPDTVAEKINLYGYYLKFKNQVKELERVKNGLPSN